MHKQCRQCSKGKMQVLARTRWQRNRASTANKDNRPLLKPKRSLSLSSQANNLSRAPSSHPRWEPQHLAASRPPRRHQAQPSPSKANQHKANHRTSLNLHNSSRWVILK